MARKTIKAKDLRLGDVFLHPDLPIGLTVLDVEWDGDYVNVGLSHDCTAHAYYNDPVDIDR